MPCAPTNLAAFPATTLAAEIAAHQGWDSILLDQQHGQIGYEAMCAMLTAISPGGTPSSSWRTKTTRFLSASSSS